MREATWEAEERCSIAIQKELKCDCLRKVCLCTTYPQCHTYETAWKQLLLRAYPKGHEPRKGLEEDPYHIPPSTSSHCNIAEIRTTHLYSDSNQVRKAI